MPKIPRFALRCILLTAVLLLQFSCGKELPPTVIKGQVTDKKTGAPIEGTTLTFEFYYSGSDGNEINATRYTKTDFEGRYYLSQTSDYSDIWSSEASKIGYVGHLIHNIIRGKENIIDASLSPKDGTLLLNVKHPIGPIDSVYVMIGNPTFIQEYESQGKILPEKFPIIISAGEVYNQYFDLPAEEYTRVYWGGSYFPALKYAPFYDSVYLKLKDTTTFTLSF